MIDAGVPVPPLTKRSKSISGSSDPAADGNADAAPNDIKSSVPFALTPLVPDSSCNFFVCSVSTRTDRLLISSIKAWNCCRFSNGPKLIFHNIGRISMATKSASAMVPICLRTFSAAIATAGSFVLIARISGTIFSCIVYLSRGVEVFFLVAPIPSRPSLLEAGSFEPPQRTTKASRPRTLIPRLLVFVNTEAITGNSSFFMVEKSRIGKTTFKLRNAASTSACVGESIEIATIGSIS